MSEDFEGCTVEVADVEAQFCNAFWCAQQLLGECGNFDDSYLDVCYSFYFRTVATHNAWYFPDARWRSINVLLVVERLHEMLWSEVAFIGIRLEASEAGRVTWLGSARLSFFSWWSKYQLGNISKPAKTHWISVDSAWNEDEGHALPSMEVLVKMFEEATTMLGLCTYLKVFCDIWIWSYFIELGSLSNPFGTWRCMNLNAGYWWAYSQCAFVRHLKMKGSPGHPVQFSTHTYQRTEGICSIWPRCFRSQVAFLQKVTWQTKQTATKLRSLRLAKLGPAMLCFPYAVCSPLGNSTWLDIVWDQLTFHNMKTRQKH